MLILDTDHIVEFQKGTSPAALRLKQRLDETSEPYATTITVEEIVRGWMAAIHRETQPRRQITAYSRLQRLFRFFASWSILEWNETAVERLESLRAGGVRCGTMDLKIASLALTWNATLLSANRVDFDRGPGLQVEDWLS